MPTDPGPGWNLLQDVDRLWSLDSMVNAYRAGTIVAIVAATVGWFLVLRRQTFAGHTVALASFPGAAAAVYFGVGAVWGGFGACVAAAVVIAALARNGDGGPAHESALTGVVQAFILACGILFVSLYRGFLNGVNALLFGSFLGVTDDDVLVLAAVAAAVLATLAVLGRRLLFASVDPAVAAARGVPVRALGVVFLAVLGAATAEVSQITGSLLVFALLVTPAATARRVTVRPALGLVLGVVIGLAVVWIGLAAAYFTVYPIGFFVTSLAFAAYLAASLAGRVRSRSV
jgi:zinc/manganese transport system permease protein